jgi:hypothetical protein
MGGFTSKQPKRSPIEEKVHILYLKKQREKRLKMESEQITTKQAQMVFDKKRKVSAFNKKLKEKKVLVIYK